MLYIVVSYNTFDNYNGAKVFVNGIYSSESEAQERQRFLCGGTTLPLLCNDACVGGNNGIISWIREIEMGDMHLDIKKPKP